MRFCLAMRRSEARLRSRASPDLIVCHPRWTSWAPSSSSHSRTGVPTGCTTPSKSYYESRAPEDPLQPNYTYILVDCPPSLNLLTINAMTAADSLLVPLQCEFFALEGLSQLLKTVERVKSNLNPRLSIHGIVLTMFDGRNTLSGQVAEDVRSFLGDKVYDTVIPRNVRISEAPSHGKPVLLYDSKCSGSQAYIKLASEIIKRERQLRAA